MKRILFVATIAFCAHLNAQSRVGMTFMSGFDLVNEIEGMGGGYAVNGEWFPTTRLGIGLSFGSFSFSDDYGNSDSYRPFRLSLLAHFGAEYRWDYYCGIAWGFTNYERTYSTNGGFFSQPETVSESDTYFDFELIKTGFVYRFNYYWGLDINTAVVLNLDDEYGYIPLNFGLIYVF